MKAHEAQWQRLGFYNGNILEVKDVVFPRRGTEESPQIRFTLGHRKYFEFLATNAQICLRTDLDRNERTWLENQLGNHSTLVEPAKSFANSLCVDVLLLCESGTKIVLCRRSRKTAFRGGMLQPFPSETVNDKDIQGGSGEIDPLNTCFRGLREEAGIQRNDVCDLVITSLIFDKQIYNYELTAAAYTDLSEKDVKGNWEKIRPPIDKCECSELVFYPFPIEDFYDLNVELNVWCHQTFVAYQRALIRKYGERDAIQRLKAALSRFR